MAKVTASTNGLAEGERGLSQFVPSSRHQGDSWSE